MSNSTSQHEARQFTSTLAHALGRDRNEPGVGRLQEAIEAAPELNPCMECGELTAGSVGAAGLRWKRLCQFCKDKADGCLSSRIKASGSIGNALYAELMGRIAPSAGDARRIDLVEQHAATRAEFLADFDAKASAIIHPCPECGAEMEYEQATTEGDDDVIGGINHIPAGWACECGHSETDE